jgi:ribosome biogenesis protein ERB1
LQLTIEPEDLLPQLPNPKDLQPFPTVMSMVYEGHTDMVRSIAVEPKGQYMVSGSDDLTVKGKDLIAYFSITDFYYYS